MSRSESRAPHIIRLSYWARLLDSKAIPSPTGLTGRAASGRSDRPWQKHCSTPAAAVRLRPSPAPTMTPPSPIIGESTLMAFQQVEDNLVALRILSQEAQQQKEATASAQESLQIFTNRYIGGRDPYLQVLTAQTIALQNERNDVDILRRRMDASVLLIKALGEDGLCPNYRKQRNCANRHSYLLEARKGARDGSETRFASRLNVRIHNQRPDAIGLQRKIS